MFLNCSFNIKGWIKNISMPSINFVITGANIDWATAPNQSYRNDKRDLVSVTSSGFGQSSSTPVSILFHIVYPPLTGSCFNCGFFFYLNVFDQKDFDSSRNVPFLLIFPLKKHNDVHTLPSVRSSHFERTKSITN